MLDSLAEFVVHGGPWALLALVVLFLMTGRLIPKSQHDRELAYRDRTITALEDTVAEMHKQRSILLGKLPEQP